MIVPIIAVTLAQLGSSTPVTVTINSCPVPDAISQLAQITHLPLKATKAADYGSLMVCVHDYPTDKLLQRVANDLGAKWEQEGSILYLKPDPAQLRELNRIGLERRAKDVTASLLSIASPGSSGLSGQNKAPDLAALGLKLIARILLAIPPEQIASLNRTERWVFSMHPTPMQRPFPPEASKQVQLAFKEIPKLLAAPHPWHGGDPNDAILEVVNTLDDPDGALNAQLFCFDNSGQVSCQIEIPDILSRNRQTSLQPKDNNDTRALVAVESPITSSYHRLIDAQHKPQSDPESLQALKECNVDFAARLQEPTNNEPSRLATDFILALAGHDNNQLVGWIPDSIAWEAYAVDKIPQTPLAIRDFQNRLRSIVIQTTESDEDLFPTEPIAEGLSYINRSELKQCIASIKSVDHIGLKELLNLGERVKGSYLPSLLQLVLDNEYQAPIFLVGFANWNLVHLLKTFDPYELERLWTGGTITSSGFNKKQVALLQEIIFGTYRAERIVGNTNSNNVDIDPFIGTADTGFTRLDLKSDEVTEALPNGLPSAFEISFSAQGRPGYRPYLDPKSSQGYSNSQLEPATLPEIVEDYLNSSTSRRLSSPGAEIPNFSAIELGDLRDYHVDFKLKEDWIARITFMDYDFANAPHFNLDSLPGQVQKQWDAELKRQKDGSRMPLKGASGTLPHWTAGRTDFKRHQELGPVRGDRFQTIAAASKYSSSRRHVAASGFA